MFYLFSHTKIYLFIFFPFFISLFINAQNIDELIKEGDDFHNKGNYDAAIIKYKEALALDNKNTTILSKIAISYFYENDYKQTVAYCKEALKYADSAFAGVQNIYIIYGNSLTQLDNPKKALEVYKHGIEKFPESYMLHYSAGMIYFFKGNYRESLNYLQKAVILNPSHPSSHFYIATIMDNLSQRVPVILAISRFLILESKWKRAEFLYPYLMQRIKGTIEQTEENQISISISPDTSENNFRTIEIFLSLMSSIDTIPSVKDENQNKYQIESFIKKFEGMCRSMAQYQGERKGFFWEYYVPYFIEMDEKGFIETFAFIITSSQTQNKYVTNWLSENKEKIDKFYYWSENYKWSKK